METGSGCQRRHCTSGTLQVRQGRASSQASTAHVVSLPWLYLAVREGFPEAHPVVRALEKPCGGCDTLFAGHLLLKKRGFHRREGGVGRGVTLVEGHSESWTETADVGW